MPATSPPALPSSRRRRWWIGGAIAALLLLYAGALTWTTRRLEVDVQKSIRALPAAGAAHREND